MLDVWSLAGSHGRPELHVEGECRAFFFFFNVQDAVHNRTYCCYPNLEEIPSVLISQVATSRTALHELFCKHLGRFSCAKQWKLDLLCKFKRDFQFLSLDGKRSICSVSTASQSNAAMAVMVGKRVGRYQAWSVENSILESVMMAMLAVVGRAFSLLFPSALDYLLRMEDGNVEDGGAFLSLFSSALACRRRRRTFRQSTSVTPGEATRVPYVYSHPPLPLTFFLGGILSRELRLRNS